MTLLTHITTTSAVAALITPVENFDLGLTILITFIINSLIDIDHIVAIAKDKEYFRQNKTKQIWHKARTSMHELFGVAVWGLITLIASFIDVQIAIYIGIISILHLSEDFLIGRSYPFSPAIKEEMFLFELNKKHKLIIESILNIFALILWVMIIQRG